MRLLITQGRKRRRSLLLLFLVLVQVAIGITDKSPYQILSVTKQASQKEIQKRYRELCLQYHPDKNVNKPPKQRERAETNFKLIQHAYNLIGDEESRRSYVARSTFSSFRGSSSSAQGSSASGHSASSPFGTDPVAEAFFRAFQNAGRGGPSLFFHRGPGGGPRFGVRRPFPSSTEPPSFMPANLSFKSIYVQKVFVPLEQLYKGVENLRLNLQDNIWTRWRAAIRGKIAYLSLYQGLIYSLPVLRTSKFLAAVVSLVIVHSTLPKPDPHQRYESTLRRGSKGGKTKVRFASTRFGQPEVVFEIEESHHKLYQRVGNDLYTTLEISPQEAAKGCTKKIPALDEENEPRIAVNIPAKTSAGDTIRISGKGWPIRNAPDLYLFGDVIVLCKIRVERKPKYKRKRKEKSS